MILQLVLINQETGEPIYETAMTRISAESAPDNMLLRECADAMLTTLKKYKSRVGPIRAVDAAETADKLAFDPSSDFGGPVNLG